MLFGAIGQVFTHGILNNVGLKQAGLRYGYNSDLATTWDWVIGFTYAAFAYIVVFRMGIMKMFENVNARYPFDATEMTRFDKLYGQRGSIR